MARHAMHSFINGGHLTALNPGAVWVRHRCHNRLSYWKLKEKKKPLWTTTPEGHQGLSGVLDLSSRIGHPSGSGRIAESHTTGPPQRRQRKHLHVFGGKNAPTTSTSLSWWRPGLSHSRNWRRTSDRVTNPIPLPCSDGSPPFRLVQTIVGPGILICLFFF